MFELNEISAYLVDDVSNLKTENITLKDEQELIKKEQNDLKTENKKLKEQIDLIEEKFLNSEKEFFNLKQAPYFDHCCLIIQSAWFFNSEYFGHHQHIDFLNQF